MDNFSKQIYEAGINDGRAEGKAEGKAEGLAEGEAKAQFTIARKMKALSLPEDQIVAATGLSIEEIRQL